MFDILFLVGKPCRRCGAEMTYKIVQSIGQSGRPDCTVKEFFLISLVVDFSVGQDELKYIYI